MFAFTTDLLTHAGIGPAILSFAELHPIGAGLCGFALMAVCAAGVRGFMRRTARREAWEFIAEDRATGRQQDIIARLTYRDTVARQFNWA